MKVTWVISEDTPTGLLDPKIIKDVATSWGSWQTWKEFKTDNCVCTNTAKANDLIKRAFHAVTNVYMMQSDYIKVGSPVGVKLFDGKFQSKTVSNKDDLVALNLAVPKSDVVLMSGFNFSPILNTDDKVTQKAREEYYFNVRDIIQKNESTQFVLVDYMHEMASWLRELDNVTVDTIESVKNLLG